jgi:hypothetical protein
MLRLLAAHLAAATPADRRTARGTMDRRGHMKVTPPSGTAPSRLVASLDGPSRTITVEPVRVPVPAPPPSTEPEPAREPERPPEPERQPEPVP